MQASWDRHYVAYGDWLIRWRWLVIAAVIAFVGFAVAGLPNLTFTSNYRVFFSKENPQLNAFEALQNIYTKTDNILFVLKPDKGDVFTPEILEHVVWLTNEAWQIPYSIRVDSISNFQHTEAEEDALIVADLVDPEEVSLEDPAVRAKIRDAALAEPFLADALVALKRGPGRATGVHVTLQLPDNDNFALNEAVTFAEDLADRMRARAPNLHVAVAGVATLSNTFPREAKKDMRFLIPTMYGIIMLTLILALRSFTGMLITLLLTLMSVLTSFGIAGWMGVVLSPPNAMAPTIILTIAIADCIHLLVSAQHHIALGHSRVEAVKESLRLNTLPVFLTSLTTAIGFLSLNASDAPPFNVLGNLAAMGVVAAWFYAMTFLPAMASLLPMRAPQRPDGVLLPMHALAEFVIARRHGLSLLIATVVIVAGTAIPTIQLDDRFVEYFDKSVPIRIDADFASENLTGSYQIDYSVGTLESGGISEPAYLEKLEAFATWFRAQPNVMHVTSFTDVMKRLNKSLHGDDPAWYRLPDKRELAAQYLLLYEMSLPFGLDLNNLINVDKSATRLNVTLDNVSAVRMREVKAQGDQWLIDHGLPGMQTEGTGVSIMFAYITQRNIQTMLWGTGFAFILISLSLILFLRNVRIGLISLIPNLVPVIMTFGIWGLLVGQLGMAGSVITATSLGLIVDATVHLLSKYLRARRDLGHAPEDAIRYAFANVGPPLLIATGVLIVGFAVLSLSSFKPNGDMGLLTAITIAFAMVVDFLLLPPLLLLIDRNRGARL